MITFFYRNLNTLVECTDWSYINKVQPFHVNISANAKLLLDFHCHLMSSEVVGYLAGNWDFPTQSLNFKITVFYIDIFSM